jgi:Circularly permutated YpsA SLOG family
MVAEERAAKTHRQNELAKLGGTKGMKLISGGQSGVDRAVLDVALSRGIAYGGWCPKGGWAEDFPDPPGLLAKYPHLQETPLADPAQRTEWNVRDADACLIVVDDGGLEVSAGTALASELAHRYRRPVLVANLANADTRKQANLWFRVQQAKHGEALKLAIGGPRESEAPGIYARATAFIAELID